MRILHYGKYYPPYRGGVETVMESLCRGLAARGEDVTALVANDTSDTVEEMRDGVRVVRLGRRCLLASQPICPGAQAFLRAWDGDAVHVHLPNPLAAWNCLRAKPRGVWLGLHHSDIVRQRLMAIPANWILRQFYAKAAAITVPSPRHIEFSDVLPAFRDRCRVIHFGIDPGEYLYDIDGEWDAGLPLAWRERPLLLFVGRLVYYKGVDVLLRALAGVPEAVLVIVGTGPEKEALTKLAGSLGRGVTERIRFLEEVSEPRLRNLYRTATALVLPSVARSEAFGMVQLEAMASGTPVISTDLPSGVPYVNVDGETGIVVPPRDAEALADALRRLLGDPGAAQRYGENGRARVLTEFNEDKMVDEYRALYHELVGGK